MKYTSVEIITPAKVASASFLESFKPHYTTKHGHSLLRLKQLLNTNSNLLFITGIREPISRNMSYFFQTYRDDFFNDVKTSKNGYKGEYCYMPEAINCRTTEEMIDMFFSRRYKYTFNEWWNEFFDITGISSRQFNKTTGLSIFDIKNNNTLLLYTLESLNNNKSEICSMFDIPTFIDSNSSRNRDYKTMYNNVRRDIKYPKDYIDTLLSTDTMKYFYTDNFIGHLYRKYHATI